MPSARPSRPTGSRSCSSSGSSRPASAPPIETGKWVDPGSAARVQLEVAIRTPGHRIQRSLIERYLAGDAGAFAEIVSFGGMTFDEAMVGVVLPDETTRVFDLARPEAGRPVTKSLPALEVDADGEPTPASLLAGLRSVLAAAARGSAAPARIC